MFRLLVAFFLSLSCCLAVAVAQQSSDTAASSSVDLESLIDHILSIELRNGKTYQDVKLLRIIAPANPDKPKKLRVQIDGENSRTWSMLAIRSITQNEKVIYKGSKSSKPKKKLSRRERAELQAAQEHEQWLARLAARGLRPWSTLSEKEHQEAVEMHKKRYELTAKLIPNMQLFETEHFLFCTNIPPQQVGVFIASLDRMYVWMQQTYGIPRKEKVWRGKASIFAFAREKEFVAFERQIMKNNPQPGTAGLCHSDGRRNVCIAAPQGTNADYFGVVLVHETSHGFIHCYKTPVRVPSWVNEGMAEVIASLMVPSSKGVARKEEKFLQALQSVPEPRLGDEFFVVNKNIPFNRYGGASSMTRFLIQTDQQKYVRFINLLKEGTPWEEALGNSFNATKYQLVASYGRWLGIPNLRP